MSKSLSQELDQKYQQLCSLLAATGGVVVAFSGGVDSTLLSRVAHDVLGERAMAVTAVSATLADEELSDARSLANSIGIRHVEVTIDELSDQDFSANPPDRCYHCKQVRLSALERVAAQHGLTAIAEGSNIDDLSDYRPGLAASKEHGVISPFLEVGMGKAEIRQLSEYLDLPNWGKPAAACLASRIPYGTRITAENLGMVGAAESFLRKEGFRVVRVRHHGNLARIEVGRDERERMLAIADSVVVRLRQLGFTFVTLDLSGYATGSLNAELNPSASARKS